MNDVARSSRTPAFDPPKQERSRDTYRRILEAADELLRERSFERVSVTEIVERAGCSEGPFYARFGDKEAFLLHLEGRLFRAREDFLNRVEERSGEAGVSPREAVRSSLRAVIRLYGEHRGIHRALVLRSRTDPELRARLRESDLHLLRRAAACLRTVSGEASGEVAASELALFAARSAIREAVLFGEAWHGDTRPTEEALVDGLAELLLGGVDPAPDG